MVGDHVNRARMRMVQCVVHVYPCCTFRSAFCRAAEKYRKLDKPWLQQQQTAACTSHCSRGCKHAKQAFLIVHCSAMYLRAQDWRLYIVQERCDCGPLRAAIDGGSLWAGGRPTNMVRTGTPTAPRAAGNHIGSACLPRFFA